MLHPILDISNFNVVLTFSGKSSTQSVSVDGPNPGQVYSY
jgi:hypothetical protein